MNRVIETTAVVGPDGVLHLDLPLGESLAGQQVALTLRAREDVANEVDPPAHPENDESYLAALDRLHGCIDDPTFDVDRNRSPKASAIQYPRGYRKMSEEEWKRFIDETAGSIDDPTFVEPEDQPPQERDRLFE